MISIEMAITYAFRTVIGYDPIRDGVMSHARIHRISHGVPDTNPDKHVVPTPPPKRPVSLNDK